MSKNLEISRLCDVYGALLTDNMQKAIRDYYDYDMSLAEIGDELGITRQAVLCRLRQAENKLLECERTIGMVKLTDRLTSELRGAIDRIDGDSIAAKAALQRILNGISG